MPSSLVISIITKYIFCFFLLIIVFNIIFVLLKSSIRLSGFLKKVNFSIINYTFVWKRRIDLGGWGDGGEDYLFCFFLGFFERRKDFSNTRERVSTCNKHRPILLAGAHNVLEISMSNVKNYFRSIIVGMVKSLESSLPIRA